MKNLRMADGGVIFRAIAYVFSKPVYCTVNTKALPEGKGTINQRPQRAGLNNRRTTKGIGRERRPGIAFRVWWRENRLFRRYNRREDQKRRLRCKHRERKWFDCLFR